MNRIYKNIKNSLKILLLVNIIFSQYNFPYSLNPMVNEDDSLLVGPDSVAFYWLQPQDDFGLTFFVDSLQDDGNGNLSFSIVFDEDSYFQPFQGFNIGINTTAANFVINSISGGITEDQGWTVINQGSNTIFGSNISMVYIEEEYTDENGNGIWDAGEEYTDENGNGIWDAGEEYIDENENGIYDFQEPCTDQNGDGQCTSYYDSIPMNPISATCQSDCVLFTIYGTYDENYDELDEDNNIIPVYIEHLSDVTEIFNQNQFEPLAEFQWLPTKWSPGFLYNGPPENAECNCTSDFNNCPSECETPYLYQVYRFTFSDLNNNGNLDNDEEWSGIDTTLIGTTEYQNDAYDEYNDNRHTFFIDTGLQPEQGYCYYVTASHSSIYNGQTDIEDAFDQQMCLSTDCITAYYYQDQDQDGLGDPSAYTPQQECGAPVGFVDNNNDDYPDCPNFYGDNPMDCDFQCFNWNDFDVVYFNYQNFEWKSLTDSTMTFGIYDEMKSQFCLSNELTHGCAILEFSETHDPDGVFNEDACEGYCCLGATGNDKSSYSGIADYEDGTPIYSYTGARNCDGSCNIIDTDSGYDGIPGTADDSPTFGNVIEEIAKEDDCGWCCSCSSSETDGMPFDISQECVAPFYEIDGNWHYDSDYNQCSFYDEGSFGGHMDCSYGEFNNCWNDPIPGAPNGPVFEDNCGICDGPNACGPPQEIESFIVSTLEDNISLELNWDSPPYFNNAYSYVPDVVIYVSDIIELDETIDGGQVVEISLGMENQEYISGFNLKINSELLLFYNNQGYGGRAEDTGISISITINNQEPPGNGQIFAAITDDPLEPGEGLLTKFKAYINPKDCIDFPQDGECDEFLGESFIDIDNSYTFDDGETFIDLNGNCKWDAQEEFIDGNGNNNWDQGENWFECNEDKSLCENCGSSSGNNNNPICEDPELYDPAICPCNEIGICNLKSNIYTKTACFDFWDFCSNEGEFACQDLDSSDVWLEWNDNLGDNVWNSEEEYDDFNVNGEYDFGEIFMDFGLDGCSDEYEDGAGGCNDSPNPLLYFSDPNNDNYDNNDGKENNCIFDNYNIDIISHFDNQTAFSDLGGNIIDDYMFLNTTWNNESMDIDKVGSKGDGFCYNSVAPEENEFESHYNGQAEDCPPKIAYKIKRTKTGDINPIIIATLVDTTHLIDNSNTEYESEYCYTMDTQVLYNDEILNYDNDGSLDTDLLFDPADDDNPINYGSIESCSTTGCDFTIMYYDYDLDGFGNPNESVLWCPGDDSANLVTNGNDLWPDCQNDIIDVNPYDCNDECNGPNVEDIYGSCCNEVQIDDCSICYGNGNSCEGLDAPQLTATSNDENINLLWNEVDVINNRNDRELLNLSVLEIDDLGYDDDCGPDGNGEECIGRMRFKIWLDNYGQSINDFNIKFVTNNHYTLDTIATYFFGVSVFNQGLALEENMNISINESNIFAQSTGSQISSSGELLYIEGTYNLSLTGQQIAVTADAFQTIFLDESGNTINHSWLPTLWTVGFDLEIGGDCGNGECEEGESFFNCPQDCEGTISYILRRDGNIIASNIEDTTYVDSYNLQEGVSYCYKVVATNQVVTSPPSDEVCTSLNCNETLVFYLDTDGDGMGDPGNYIEECVLPNGYVENSDDEWPDCFNEPEINPYDCTYDPNNSDTWENACNGLAIEDCLGICDGEADIDECGECNGDGPVPIVCWWDSDGDGCHESPVTQTICSCSDLEGNYIDSEEDCTPLPEAPLYLTALGSNHHVNLDWESLDQSTSEQNLQLIVSDINTDGNGNVDLEIFMTNPEAISGFNFRLEPDNILSNLSVSGGLVTEAGMMVEISSGTNVSVAITDSDNDIPIGGGVLMNISADYNESYTGEIEIITLTDESNFNHNRFYNASGEDIETFDWLPVSWLVGSGFEDYPEYCGDQQCNDNEDLGSCPYDCTILYNVYSVNEGSTIGLDLSETFFVHSNLLIDTEYCYNIFAYQNNSLVETSPEVCTETGLTSAPYIVSIEDQPDDDGGVVILRIEPINIDTVFTGDFYEVFRKFKDGEWMSVDLFGAYGSSEYIIETNTVADQTIDEDGNDVYNFHSFKVSYTGIFSDIVEGYSINNNPPDAPSGLVIGNPGGTIILLEWDPNTEADLGYYNVYSREMDSGWDSGFTTNNSYLIIENIPSQVIEYSVTASDSTGNESEYSNIVSTDELDLTYLDTPKEFTLYPTYPNPFNPITNIRYGLAEPGQVHIKIYDIVGREVTELVNEYKPAGTFEISWNAENYNSGLYFVKCSTNSKTLIQKILLIK